MVRSNCFGLEHLIILAWLIKSFQSFFGLGSGGAQISITVTPPVDKNGTKLVKLSKTQKWKAHKNPYHQFHYFSEKLGKLGNGPNTQIVPQPAYGSLPAPDLYAYDANTDVEGIISLMVPPGKKVEHLGIRVEFVGRIETVSKHRVFHN